MCSRSPQLSESMGCRTVSGRKLYPGFTLIEMLVVLAIVALLLTIATPRYFGSIDRSKEAVLKENLRVMRESIDKFYGDQGRYPMALEELVERRYLHRVPVDPITESALSWVTMSAPGAERGNVADVRSGASGAGKDGSAYADW